MAKEENSNKTTNEIPRKEFLKKMGLIGAGTTAASLIFFNSNEDLKAEPGKKIKALTSNNKVVEVKASDIIEVKKEPSSEKLQHRGREGLTGKKFVMVIDLSECKNARKCMHACQSAHQLKPEQHHINVLKMEDEMTGSNYFMPKPCMHCDEPQCVAVCPVDATFKRQDGLVLIDNERCIGCRFCIAACPYSARSFNWTDPKDAEKYKNVKYDVELNVPQKLGTVTKCAFSADRLRKNKLPYCVSSCPNGVYYFGNANEDMVTNGTTLETVRLSKLLKENSAYTLLPELGTKPNVFYLPPNRKKG